MDWFNLSWSPENILSQDCRLLEVVHGVNHHILHPDPLVFYGDVVGLKASDVLLVLVVDSYSLKKKF